MSASKVFLYLCLAYIAGVFIFTDNRFQGDKSPVLNDGGPTSIIGVVTEEPDVREKSQKLTVSNSEYGRILVTAKRYPEYRYGDKLEITGSLKKPSDDINGFNYKDYLKKDGIYYVMNFSKIRLAGSGFGSPVKRFLLSFKNRFEERVENFIPSPQIGFLEALVFGEEGEIPDNWKEKLNLTGTRHIAAVSGMNITLISALLLNFLLLLGLWRSQAFYLTIILIIFYILMIGAPPSAVRAGVMASLFLTAQHLGRLSAAPRAVVFASALMLGFNPLLLRLDVGFQLSFLATMGLIYLQPIFNDLLKRVPDVLQSRYTLAATLSAQVFTLPILIYNFGYFSLISPLANVLIVPLLAPLTILIFVFGFSAMIFGPLSWLISFPVFAFLAYLTTVIEFFSKIPFILLSFNVSWHWLAIFYLILGFLIWKLRARERLKFLKY